MLPEIKIEVIESDPYFKISLSNYDHVPNKTKYNTRPVYKNNIFSTDTLEPFLNFEVFEDDVWIITYPKCGTTWSQEMVWLLMNNMDFEKAKSIDIELRSRFVDYSLKCLETSKTDPRPRVLKTHEKMQLLPKEIWTKNPKIIFMCRDPRDVFVSMYHHSKFFFGKMFTDDVERVIEGRMKYSDFWEQVLSFYAMKDKDNVMFLSFEQMKKDLKSVILRVSDFLGKQYPDAEVDKLVDHLDFKNMKSKLEV